MLPQLRSDPIRTFRDAADRYGDLVHLKAGPYHGFLLTDPADIKHVLQDKGQLIVAAVAQRYRIELVPDQDIRPEPLIRAASRAGYPRYPEETRVMTTFLLALLIGIIAGLRSMMAPAAVSWGARVSWLNLAPTGLAFLGAAITPWILTALALGELVADQLPSTPSRTLPLPFGARILSGGLSGAAIGAASGSLVTGLIAGVIGAVIGTLGGRAARGKLAAAFGKDRPAALIEDAVAIGGAFLIITAAR